MKCEVLGDTSFPLVRVTLQEGEIIKAESGAMVAMSEGLELTGKMDGGLKKALGRLVLSGESFFMQQIEAKKGAGWALLAASMPGEIATLDVKPGQEWLVQKGGFLCGTPGIAVSTKVQSLMKGVFSGQGLFVVKIHGEGTAFLSTYGSIYPIELKPGECITIDNGHLVAWQSTIKYEITKGAKSWTSSLTSGEGLACRFWGPGQVLIQTRNPSSLGAWLLPFLPIRKYG